MNHLITHLNKLAKELTSSFNRMNYGGCCCIAAIVGQQLEKHVPTRIRVASSVATDGPAIEDVRPVVKNNTPREWERNGICFGHVILEFDYEGKTYHFDSNGVKPYKPYEQTYKYPLFTGYLTTQEAVKIASYKEGWNTSFDRDQLPSIRKMVKKFFTAEINTTPSLFERLTSGIMSA